MARKTRSALGRIVSGLQSASEVGVDRERDAVTKEESDQGKSSELLRHRQMARHLSERAEQRIIREVDTNDCRLWARHNRMYELLNQDDCSDLIASFRASGQQEAAIARRLKHDREHLYEIVVGARRLWTARFLKLPLKVEIREMSDEEAFLLSDASNTAKDISEYERAVEYKDALKRYYQGAQARMAQRLNVSESKVSRLLTLANLDPAIISAYSDPREIAVDHAVKLKGLMKPLAVRTRILERAEALTKESSVEGKIRSGKEVFAELRQAGKGLRGRRNDEKQSAIRAKQSDRTMFTIRGRRNGSIEVVIEPKSGASIEELLLAFETELRKWYPDTSCNLQ